MTAADSPLHARVPDGFFARVVDRFYDAVEADPILLPLYPEGPATDGARWRLARFLEQYFGGATTYSEQRGHPRLRMRHAPYLIGDLERDRWLVHMVTAIEAECAALDPGVGGPARSEFVEYVTMAAEHLRNA